MIGTVRAGRSLAALVFGLVVLAAGCTKGSKAPVSQPELLPAPAPVIAEGEAVAETSGEESSGELGVSATPVLEPLPPLPAGDETPGGDSAAEDARPIRLRVGLATDQSEVLLPCCGEDIVARWNGGSVALTAVSRVRPGGSTAGRARYRLQVAALRDERQARELAARLGRSTGEPADTSFDAESGLYRVRLGSWSTRPEAETERRRIAAFGTPSAWVVSEGGEIRNPSLQLVVAGRAIRVPGRWLRIGRRGSGGDAEEGLRAVDGTYRGHLLVYLNDRARLNVINDLALEDYLRGVVPAEMGPELYPRLEALKAQAVAARTYTLRHLREFEAEGFDICAAPRCQVYRGMTAEHPLSDRAIAETARQVMMSDGELIDARYTATCGGHTEDVEVVFPLEVASYLRAVPCIENGSDRLVGDVPVGEEWPQVLTRRLFTAPGSTSPEARYANRLGAVAGTLAGTPRDRLASLERGEVRRFVRSLFDLALGAEALAANGDAGLLPGVDNEPVGADEAERLLYGLAVAVGRIESVPGFHRAVELEGSGARTLWLRTPRGEERRIALPSRIVTLRRRGTDRVSGDLELVPGDRVTVVLYEEQPVAVLQEVDPGPPDRERGHPLRSWTRFRSDRQLAQQVEKRYPGLGFSGFEILERGVSGRVRRLRLLGAGGKTLEVAGLAVRWTLDVPESRFTAERARSPRGERGYRFSGSGWGHGVGMCQVGGFAMAGRRHTYRQILQHYYSGATLARVQRRAPGAVR